MLTLIRWLLLLLLLLARIDRLSLMMFNGQLFQIFPQYIDTITKADEALLKHVGLNNQISNLLLAPVWIDGENELGELIVAQQARMNGVELTERMNERLEKLAMDVQLEIKKNLNKRKTTKTKTKTKTKKEKERKEKD